MLKKLYYLFLNFDKVNQNRVVLVFALSIFGSILEIIGIGLIYPILNYVISENNSLLIDNILSKFIDVDNENIKIYLLLFFAFFIILKNIILTFSTYIFNKTLALIRHFVSVKLFSGYLSSDYDFFINSNSGELTKNLTSKVHSFNLNIILPFGILLTEIFIIIIFTWIALYIAFIDTIFIMIFIFLPAFIFFKWSKSSVKQNGINNQFNESLRIRSVIEMIGSIKDIKILNKNNYFLNKYSIYDWNVSFAICKQYFINQYSKFFLEAVLVLSVITICFINVRNGMSLYDLIPLLGFYAVAAFRLMPSVSRILNSLQMLKFGEVIVDEINFEFNRTKNLLQINDPKKVTFQKSINLKNISFRYSKDGEYILKKINLNVKKGEMLGIFGKTGEGKSTLINLILGLLKPSIGSVLIDNKIVSKNNSLLSSIFGYVPQDIFLLDDTIKNNIAFGEDENLINNERVLWALREARLDIFVKKQKKGINSPVGDKGIKISGGQRQRIGIARALYHGAKILIFDEATSALDEITENEIIENIKSLKGRFTVIIITHRLKTLKILDRSFKLSKGTLIESTNLSL